jgi:hypothetical protein
MAPEIISNIYKSDTAELNPSKTDMYSLGTIILQLALLKSNEEICNLQLNRTGMENTTKLLKEVEKEDEYLALILTLLL